MTVDLLIGRAVLTLKLNLNICRSIIVSISTCRQKEGTERERVEHEGLMFVTLLAKRLRSKVDDSPGYSGKQIVSGDFLIFSANRSFLLRKRMMEVSMKNLLLQMESKSMSDSCMRFCRKNKKVSSVAMQRVQRAGFQQQPNN